jgi:L-ascorbate metabolism protein UlaG (beta-lactamase superfamily)
MEIQLLRHATLAVTYGGRRLLVDPMLSPAEAMDPVANAGDDRRIPLVGLPMSDEELAALLAGLDAVIVTHTHRDHWDPKALELLPRGLTVFCQPSDATAISVAGFGDVQPVETSLSWEGLELHRTGGRHGTGEVGARMGAVSGFVLRAPGEPALYLAGDTIWCEEVAAALAAYSPEVAVLNAGAAQFLVGDPITMTAADVAAVCRAAPSARLVAVHMEAVNHCRQTRAGLREALEAEGLAGHVAIPADGQVILFGAAEHAR